MYIYILIYSYIMYIYVNIIIFVCYACTQYIYKPNIITYIYSLNL